MQYDNLQGFLQAPQGDRTRVFYVVRIMDASIGNRDPIPIEENVNVVELECREDSDFPSRYSNQSLILELKDKRTIEVEWRGEWLTKSGIRPPPHI